MCIHQGICGIRAHSAKNRWRRVEMVKKGKEKIVAANDAAEEDAHGEEDVVKGEQRRIFDEQLNTVLSNARGNTAFLSREKFERIVNVLSSWDTWTGAERKEHKDGYDHIKNYMLVEMGGHKVLCYNDKCKTESVDDAQVSTHAFPVVGRGEWLSGWGLCCS